MCMYIYIYTCIHPVMTMIRCMHNKPFYASFGRDLGLTGNIRDRAAVSLN